MEQDNQQIEHGHEERECGENTHAACDFSEAIHEHEGAELGELAHAAINLEDATADQLVNSVQKFNPQEISLVQLVEGLLLAAGKPMTEADILQVFDEEERPSLSDFRQAIYELEHSCADRGFNLVQVASGYQLIVKANFAKWVSRLFTERPQKYTRALLETLALVAYRQPITRGEIEEIRGVAVSTSTFRTLDERGWVRIVGHRDVPGRPALYATTKTFLDYFGLKSLDELPALPEIMQMDALKTLALETEIGESTAASTVETAVDVVASDMEIEQASANHVVHVMEPNIVHHEVADENISEESLV